MTSLPKRGDRVRVTELPSGYEALTPLLGTEHTLAHDSGEHPVYSGFIGFSSASGAFVSPVKVEILERAIHPSHVEPGGGDAPLCPACGESTGMREPCRGHSAEYARGMRRAVEIAESLSLLSSGVHDRIVPLYDLKDAIEKELANA